MKGKMNPQREASPRGVDETKGGSPVEAGLGGGDHGHGSPGLSNAPPPVPGVFGVFGADLKWEVECSEFCPCPG